MDVSIADFGLRIEMNVLIADLGPVVVPGGRDYAAASMRQKAGISILDLGIRISDFGVKANPLSGLVKYGKVANLAKQARSVELQKKAEITSILILRSFLQGDRQLIAKN